jgi:MFS family permease
MLLWVLVGGHAIKHVFSSGVLVVLPELKAALGLSYIGVGAISTVKSVSGSLANFPSGYVADRFNTRFVPILSAVLVLVGVALFALGRAQSLRDAMIFSAVLMFGISFWHPPAIGALSRVFKGRRGFAIALHGTGGSLGEVLGPLIVGGLLVVVSWRVLLQFGMAPAVVAAVIVFVLLRSHRSMEPGTVSAGGYLKAFGGMLRNRKLLAVLAIAGGFAATQGTVMTFLPIYVREDLGRSTWVVGAYVSISQAMGIGSQPVMGYLSDKVGRKAVIVPMLMGLGLTLLALYLTVSGVLFVVALAATGAFLFSGLALVLAAASDVVGDEVQATSVSLVFASTALFAGLGPLFGGLIADAFEVRAVFLFASAVVLTTGVFALFARFGQTKRAA